MTNDEAIEIIRVAMAQMEWDYPMDYAAAFDKAVEALEAMKGPSRSFMVIDSKTGKEADTYEIALHEEWAKHLIYCDIDGWALGDDGSLMLIDDCGRFAYADRERFKVVWGA